MILTGKLYKLREDERKKKYTSLEELMPKVYKELVQIYQKLEKHYRDMQDIEFTVSRGKLWMLQARTGKRAAKAAVHIAVDMVKLAYNDAYDTSIIISGDGDFVPAVKAVQEKGKRVEHAYFKIGHSWFLKQTCNKSILMDENLIKDCFG